MRYVYFLFLAISALVFCHLSGKALADSQSLSFDIVSVKQNTSHGLPTANMLLDSGGTYSPNGGRFSATGQHVIAYITFAYELSQYSEHLTQTYLPKWANTERFDIEARAPAGMNPDKDQMRLMMRTLLADRFRLTVHTETRQVPALALVLATPGNTHKLQRHSNDPPCNASSSSLTSKGYPMICGEVLMRYSETAGGPSTLFGRDVTLQQFADALSYAPGVALNPPIVDRTALTGRFDFALEYASASPKTGEDDLNSSGQTILDALRTQMGLRLKTTKASLPFLIVDHIEEPSEN